MANGVVGILIGCGLIVLGFVLLFFVFGIPSIFVCLFGYATLKKTVTWLSFKISSKKDETKKKKEFELH